MLVVSNGITTQVAEVGAVAAYLRYASHEIAAFNLLVVHITLRAFSVTEIFHQAEELFLLFCRHPFTFGFFTSLVSMR